ncbi:MAG TPA: flagellar basal body L-ring protein FlgH [Acetobacteraceae bacterium]|nr:flagellar basal body L-ring protein FlgH [Acetobacteraceae bacterium]
MTALSAHTASADNLYRPGSWPALASDRNARQVGDLVTILVYENASATNSASSGSAKSAKMQGAVTAGHSFNKSGGVEETGASDSSGTTGRSGQMVAQISATVSAVEPNGDLDIRGEQVIHINGERTLIKIKGRVRTADISTANTVLSTRLADAMIDYDGSGFVSRSARPGIVTRIFSWLGLL